MPTTLRERRRSPRASASRALATFTTAAVALLCAVSAPARAQSGYCFHDLGTFGGPLSYALTINDADPPVVGGEADLENDRHKGFLFSDWETGGGLLLAQHVLGGGEGVLLPDCTNENQCNTRVSDVNDVGDVAGTGTLPVIHHALRYPPIEDLGADETTAGAESFGEAINASGDVVGVMDVSVDGDRYRRAFLYNGIRIDLDAGAALDSEARDINDAGLIVGQRGGRATLWKELGNGQWQRDLLEESDGSIALGINVADEVVGSRFNKAAAWNLSPDEVWVVSAVDTDFATESVARANNDRGEIVGSKVIDGERRAHLWLPDLRPDIDAVVHYWDEIPLYLDPAVPPDWVLLEGLDVNESGWIAGIGYQDLDGDGLQGAGEFDRAVVLRPIEDVALCPGGTGARRAAPAPAPPATAVDGVRADTATASAPAPRPAPGVPVRSAAPLYATTLLWSNGSHLTGIGCNGASSSGVEPPSVYYGASVEADVFHQADDFTVPDGETWRVATAKWRLYMTGAAEEDPLQEIFVRLYDHPPETGSVPLAGDLVTNRLLQSTFSGVYRDDNDGGCARPLQEVLVDVSWMPPLVAGSYWIEVAARGDDTLAGPWATLAVPAAPTDDSRRLDVATGIWAENLEPETGSSWDYPFELFGVGGSLTLAADATCPGGGPFTAEWGGATPYGPVTLVYGAEAGSFTLRDGPCADTVLGVSQTAFSVVLETNADAGGGGRLELTAPNVACDGLMQLVDLTTCTPSAAVPFE